MGSIDAAVNSAFGQAAILIFLGWLLKVSSIGSVERCWSITRPLLKYTLPATVFQTLLQRFHSIDLEKGILLGGSVSQAIIVTFVSFIVFHRKNLDVKGFMIASSIGYNVGVFFYPIMEQIYGKEGLLLLAMFDFSVAVYFFSVVFFLYQFFGTERDLVSGNESALSINVHLKEDSNVEPELTEQTALVRKPERVKLWSILNTLDLKGFMWRMVANIPFYAYILGMICGACNLVLPGFLAGLLDIVASANQLLSFVVLGMYLDFSRSTFTKKNLILLAQAIALKYSLGLAASFGFYYAFGGIISDLGRLCFLIGFSMPMPSLNTVFAQDFGYDPNFAGLAVNVSNIISFVVLWILLSLYQVPIPPPSPPGLLV